MNCLGKYKASPRDEKMFQHSEKEFQYSQNMFQKNRPARARRGLPHRTVYHFFLPGEIPYICGKVLRPPPPHLIYAREEPAPPLPPMLPQVVLPRDALLREVRRILPWKDARWKKVVVPRVTPSRVFYMPPLPLLALPPPRVILSLPHGRVTLRCQPPRKILLLPHGRVTLSLPPPRVLLLLPPPRKVTLSLPPPRVVLLLPPPVGRVIYIHPPRKVTLSLPPPRIPLLLPPPLERGFILVGGVRPIRREERRIRRRDPLMLPFPRRRFSQEPPPEHEIYKGMVIKPPGKFLTILIILLTLPGWVILWALGGFALKDLGGKK